jgi:hypothetical protein
VPVETPEVVAVVADETMCRQAKASAGFVLEQEAKKRAAEKVKDELCHAT